MIALWFFFGFSFGVVCNDTDSPFTTGGACDFCAEGTNQGCKNGGNYYDAIFFFFFFFLFVLRFVCVAL
jgi:hypothetical protein